VSLIDLPGPSLAAKLSDEFVKLNKSGRCHRMAFRDESAGRIDRYTAAEPCFTPFSRWPALASVAEAHILDLQNLGKGACVVYLRDVYFIGANPRLFVCLQCAASTDMLIEVFWLSVNTADEHKGFNAHGP
jgi:hypothetical protein